MRQKFALALTVSSLCLLTAPAFAQEEQAEKPQDQTDQQAPAKISPEAYLEVLLNKITADPSNLKLNFEYASLARKMGLLDEAVSAYERMLIHKPDLPRVKLDLALAYMQLKDFARAETLFNEVLDGNPPVTVRQNINNMLARIGAAQKRHQLTGSIGFGYASDSNASAAPNSGTVSVFDVLVPVGAGGGEDADESIFATASVNHSYTFNQKKGYTWDTSLSVYKTEQMSIDTLDLTVYNVKTGPTYTVNNSTKVGFEGAYSDIKLAHQDYLEISSLQADVEKVIHPKVKVSAYGKMENRDFTNSRTTTTYEDKDGKAREFGATALVAATPKDIFNISLAHRREDTQTLYNDNVQKSVTLAYTRVLPKDMFFNASWQSKNSQYKGVDILVSPTIVRKDNARTISALLGKKFKGDWTVSANYQHAEADSNLVNYEYENEKILLSATKQFSHSW